MAGWLSGWLPATILLRGALFHRSRAAAAAAAAALCLLVPPSQMLPRAPCRSLGCGRVSPRARDLAKGRLGTACRQSDQARRAERGVAQTPRRAAP